MPLRRASSVDERERLGFNGNSGTYGSLPQRSKTTGANPRSIHFRSQQLSTRQSTRNNILASTRSFLLQNEGIKKINTLLKDNVRLFNAEQLDAEGLLYMKEEAFYNRKVEPEFALSMSPNIYRKMVDEVNASHSLPMGLYFCCHGGDGAHTGVAHEDFVGIGVAYVVVGLLFVVIVALVLMLPNPTVGA